MRHEGWIWLAVCVLLACAGPASAAGCTLDKYGTLSVEMIGERPTTLVKVNGAVTRFAIDTGAWFSFMSRASADALGLRLTPAPFGFRMGGIGGSADAEIARIKDLGILDADLHNVDFLVGGSDAGEASLGANLLDFQDLEIDLAQGKVTLFKPDGCRKSALAYWVKDGGAYNVADLQPGLNDPRSFVDVTINGKSVRALLDSGAPATLLDRRAAERVGIDLHGPGVKAGSPVGGLGEKTYQSWIVPIDSFSVGTETIQHSEMQVMDGNFGDGSTDMVLGVDFMLAHHMYIANSQHKLYFTYNGGRVFSLDTASIGAHEPAAATTNDAGGEPKTAADYALRGQARLARGELANALSDLDAAIRLDPGSADDHLTRARILLAREQPDAAMDDLDKALALDPKNLDALLLRAQLHYGKKDETDAAADLAAAQKLAPPGSMQSRYIASLYVAIDEPANAVPLLDAWIRAHEDDASLGDALNERCWARALANQSLDDALHDCREAIKRDGDRADYVDSLGMVYLRMGNYAESIKAYRQALAQSPHTAWSHYGLGLAELHSGQSDAGNAELATARSLDKDIGARAAKLGLVAPAGAPAKASGAQPSKG